MNMAHTILVVDDDPHIRDVVRFAFEKTGMNISIATDGKEALRQFDRNVHDLIVLDVGMPEMDGLEVCRQIRKTAETPILFLSARDEEIDRILGLEIGGDDYVTKPFSPRELVARVKALLRRANPLSEPESGGGAYEKGRLRMDFGTYQVFVDAKKRELALREFELLKFFVQHPMRVYTREQLLDMVWGRDTFVEPRTVDVHVRRLRQHIERDDANPELILTVRSVGYRFNPEALG
jgi:two-component system, OmpR family, response regulator